MDINGAEFITRYLEQQGVRQVVGIPGGALLPLYRALADARLQHVLARHEQGAAFIAQGMARITGRAGVCLATSGPGVTNLLTALADAKADSVPLVALCGQVPRALIGTDAFQEVRTGHLVDSITKAHFQIRAAEDLPTLLPEALRIAESGRPGPVVLDIPKDVQTERFTLDQLPPAAQADRPSALDPKLIGQAARMIDAALRPVLYLGGGVTQARAQAQALRLLERASLPTTTTLMALGTVPADHPLALGMLGQHGARATNRVIDECDLLVVVGARFDDRAIGRADRFAPHAQVIHIDADARELGKIRTPQLAIEADAGLALDALARAVSPRLRADWLARTAGLRHQYGLRFPGDDDISRPYGLVREVAALAGPDAVVTTDVGQHQMWVAQRYPLTRPRRWLTSGGLGSMGFGLPAAIGAALALPDAPVVCFSGDGSLLMNAQELATLADLQADVKIVVMDNAGLGLVRQQQTLFYQQRLCASVYARRPQLDVLAQAYGVPAVDLGTATDPVAALHAAFAQRGPVLIRAPIADHEQVLPMVTPGCANTEAIDY